MEQFMESTVQKHLGLMEKGIRKNDTKLKNMKNLMMNMKDKQEEKKTTKLI